MSNSGFRRWIRLPADDLPLIRPPLRHILARFTGGLSGLYAAVKDLKGAEQQCKDLQDQDQDLKSDAKSACTSELLNNKEGKLNNAVEEHIECEGEKVVPKVRANEEGKIEEDVKDGETKLNVNNVGSTEGSSPKIGTQEVADEITSSILEKTVGNELQITDTTRNLDGETKVAKDSEAKSASDEAMDADSSSKLDGDAQNESESEKSDENSDSEKSEDSDDEDAEETTPFTDEDGEFCPEDDMPLLADRYQYEKKLARGQSAIIIRATDTFSSNRAVAIKVLHRVYKPIGSQEADILLELHRADPWHHVPFARLLNQFVYGPHYCLVFSGVSPTPLYTHYEQNDVREASSLPHIRSLTVKLLTVLGFLHKQNIIHADLKPENILLQNEDDLSSIVVIDFGNALRNTVEELSLYYSDFELQTLLYRAPEVIFGIKFSLEVDIWSLGCLLAECYLGEPLFMGKTKMEMLEKITALLGPFPSEFSQGEYSEDFAAFIGRPMSRYERIDNIRKQLKDCKDLAFLIMLERMLTYQPEKRVTPFEAVCSPFVASSVPFLYVLPPPGSLHYPPVLMDMGTYPYLPGLPEENEQNETFATERRRLCSFSSQTNGDKSSCNSKADTERMERRVIKDAMVGKDLQDSKEKPQVMQKDVQKTLKSMGLRCEDFTISVYSRDQARQMLKSQQNANETGKKPVPDSPSKRGETCKGKSEVEGTSVNKSAKMSVAPPEDDDDDCVILDPPEGCSVPKRSIPIQYPRLSKPGQYPMSQKSSSQQYRARVGNPRQYQTRYQAHHLPAHLPQQFQLMGTTVQVSRGTKRTCHPTASQPYAKKSHMNPYVSNTAGIKTATSGYREPSVQDTLKRLKNYNISITCRKNPGGKIADGFSSGSRGRYIGTDDEDEDSDDTEDLTKYLECQIGVDEPVDSEEDQDEKMVRTDEELNEATEIGSSDLNESNEIGSSDPFSEELDQSCEQISSSDPLGEESDAYHNEDHSIGNDDDVENMDKGHDSLLENISTVAETSDNQLPKNLDNEDVDNDKDEKNLDMEEDMVTEDQVHHDETDTDKDSGDGVHTNETDHNLTEKKCSIGEDEQLDSTKLSNDKMPSVVISEKVVAVPHDDDDSDIDEAMEEKLLAGDGGEKVLE